MGSAATRTSEHNIPMKIFQFVSCWSCNPQDKQKLQPLFKAKEPLEKFRSDLQPKGCLEGCQLHLHHSKAKELENLLIQDTAALRDDIEARFKEEFPVISCFSVFNPLSLPLENNHGFDEYGQMEVKKAAAHYFKGEASNMEQYEN